MIITVTLIALASYYAKTAWNAIKDATSSSSAMPLALDDANSSELQDFVVACQSNNSNSNVTEVQSSSSSSSSPYNSEYLVDRNGVQTNSCDIEKEETTHDATTHDATTHDESHNVSLSKDVSVDGAQKGIKLQRRLFN